MVFKELLSASEMAFYLQSSEEFMMMSEDKKHLLYRLYVAVFIGSLLGTLKSGNVGLTVFSLLLFVIYRKVKGYTE